MSINYKICSTCKVSRHNAAYPECFRCAQMVTVVYDLGENKEEYFKTHPGYMKRSELPINISPTEDLEVYASQLK